MNRMSEKLTRRAVLCGTAGAFGAATLIGIIAVAGPALADNKIAQKAVNYQETPKGTASCSNCALFQAPDACQNVSGDISPQGWCKIYRPKQKST